MQVFNNFIRFVHVCIVFTRYVTLSHLRLKGKARVLISYNTGSGMLTRYVHT